MAARNRLRIEPGRRGAFQFGGPNGALRWLGMRFRPENASTGRSATLRSADRNSARESPVRQHAVETSRVIVLGPNTRQKT
jgi:hypothetical protein